MVPNRRNEGNWRVYVAAGALGLVLVASAIVDRRPKNNSREDSNKERQHRSRVRAPAKKYQNYQHATEEEHQTAEQINWRNTNRVGCATLVLTFIAAFCAGGAFYEAKRQADADVTQTSIAQGSFVASERPWIEVVGIRIIGLLDLGRAIEVITELSIKNIGHSPAVHTFPAIAESTLAAQGYPDAKAICAKGLRTGLFGMTNNGAFGFDQGALFPDETEVKRNSLVIMKTQISHWRQITIDQGYGLVRAQQGKGAADKIESHIIESANSTFFYVAGCVPYTFEGSPAFHTTEFGYIIDRDPDAPGNGDHATAVDLSRPLTLKPSDLRLTKAIGLTFAD